MIRSKKESSEIIIDLTGPDGNAYVLLGTAKRYADQIGIDSDRVIEEMTSSDYENLVETFDRYFGHFVILER